MGERLTAKIYVDEAFFNSVDESSLLRLDPNEKLELYEQDSLLLNSTVKTPETTTETPTKAYVDSLHENSRNRRDLTTVFNNQFENLASLIMIN